MWHHRSARAGIEDIGVYRVEMASGGAENRTTTRRSRLQLFQGIGWQAPRQRRLGRCWRSRAAGGGRVLHSGVLYHVGCACSRCRFDGERQWLLD
jgi:hypothetical protein